MFDGGKLKICRLLDIGSPGDQPKQVLVVDCEAYFDNVTVGVTRAYSAMSANQQIDLLVRCYNTPVPIDAEYVLIGDKQYRISLKQQRDDNV